MLETKTATGTLPIVGAAVRNIIIFIAVLSVPLAAASTLNLTTAQTSSWILVLYGLSGLLSILLTWRHRQPLLLTGNLFVIIFISRLGDQLTYSQIIGAAVVAGTAVLLIGFLGLTDRLAKWVPTPIVFGLLAGAVFSFVTGIFSEMTQAPLLVGSTFIAYLLSRALLGKRIPAILPALLTGGVLTAVTGQFGQPSITFAVASPEITWPAFSLPAILAASTVFFVMITLQANLPSLRYLQSEGYDPPDEVIDAVSGIGTFAGSLLGPVGISLSLPATSLIAGPQVGDHDRRYLAVYLIGGAAIAVGLLAGVAADIAGAVPEPLLLALAGLAVIEIFGKALQEITRGPLLLGPLFTFLVAASEMALFGFGSFFWALVIGLGVSLLLERDQLQELREKPQQM